MDRLVFTANTAMSEYRIDRQAMTHELANVSTIGFKKAFQVANRSVRVEGDGFDTRFLPRAFTTSKVDLTPGTRMVTGKPLDVALNGSTVLGVLSDDGELAWTRRGDLQVNLEGFLQTGEGHLVLDDSNAPIQVPLDGGVFQITEDGSILIQDPNAPETPPQLISQLLLKDGSTTDFARREDGLFKPVTNTEDGFDFATGPEAAFLTSGALEGSNVSVVHSLVKFVDHMRSFEMQTKIIKEMKDNDVSGEAMMRLS